MDLEKFYKLVQLERIDEAHRHLDDEIKCADPEETSWIHYRRTGLYIGEKRYDDAIKHLEKHRNRCGNIISAHNTLAMIHDVLGQTDLALNELETAPYGSDQDIDPLLTADVKFYRLYLRARNGLEVPQHEIDEIPDRYEMYLPAGGRIRGALVRKADILGMIKPPA